MIGAGVAAGLGPAVVTWLLSTRFGLSLRAIGGDEQAAGMSGVRVRSVKIVAYVLGGLLAALGGMYMAISMSSGSRRPSATATSSPRSRRW